MMFFLSKGFRVDCARPSRPWPIDPGRERPRHGHLRRRLARPSDTLDLKNAVHVGHSTGGGEVARYVAGAASGRVAKAVLISAVRPDHVKTDQQPRRRAEGVFDASATAGRRPTGRNSTSIHAAILRLQPAGREGVGSDRETGGGRG